MRHPERTFGIRDASDLLDKLVFDLARLQGAVGHQSVRYAAFDCVVVSLHLVDWVMHSLPAETCLHLYGCSAEHRGAVKSFIEATREQLPHLASCELIANSSKHLVLRRDTAHAKVDANSMTRFTPPFDANNPDMWATVTAHAVAVVTIAGKEMDAQDFFREVVRDWHSYLEGNSLLRAKPPEPHNIFS